MEKTMEEQTSDLGLEPWRMVKPFTRRENEVTDLVMQAKSNAEIAEELGIGVETAKEHVANALRKTGTRNRTELAVWGLRYRDNQSDLDRMILCCKSMGLDCVVMEEAEFSKSFDPRRASGRRLFLGETSKENLHGRFLSFSAEGKFRGAKWQT